MAINSSKLITFTRKGLYCPKADLYIDPWRKVEKALITHGHSDHARRGSTAYLCHHHSVPILKHRLGKISVQGIAYGELLNINGVKISFHPAGHVLGSAQIKIEDESQSWVISGDYKLDPDGVCAPYEPVPCDHFVTESTFGLPVYRWKDPQLVFEEMNNWWQQNASINRPTVITAYSLGKAQRILRNIDASIGPIVTHDAVEKINAITRSAGVMLPETQDMETISSKDLQKALILCPGQVLGSKWSSKLENPSIGAASGWMALRNGWGRKNLDKGFVLSDHADWPGLNRAVQLSMAENIYVTHGYTSAYTRYLNEQGYLAAIVETEYDGDESALPVTQAAER